CAFADPATALWTRHFPYELLADASMEDAIDLQKGAKINVEYDWNVATMKQAMIMIGCRDAEKPGEGASFYDLLCWWLDRNGGWFLHDYANAKYLIAGAAPTAGEAEELDPADFAVLRAALPDVPRHATNVLNVDAAHMANTAVANDLAVAPTRRDVLVREAIPARVDDRAGVETARLKVPPSDYEAVFARFPTVSMYPYALVAFTDPDWSATAVQKGKSCRVRSYSLSATARAEAGKAFYDGAFNRFEVDARATLTTAPLTHPRLPPFRAPRYPIFVEAKVVASGGAAEDRTWVAATDDKTSISTYTVDVPLWNKKIPALFFPSQFTGHHFFPAYKAERVLVALDLHSAEIARFLEWAPGARLPADSQGNHILLGKRDVDHTSIRHVYVDAKPELVIERVFGKDLQTLTVNEGGFHLVVKEDDSATEVTPSYDVNPQVAQSKGELSMKVGSSLGDFNSALGGHLGDTTTAMTSTTTEVGGEVDAASAEISQAADETHQAVQSQMSNLTSSASELDKGIDGAISDLDKLAE
ncbi:MAG TPA: hypothetical protein VHF22_01430, partial [Planctomycetota bacterium]|nr:hypothetical protein [Planctomycetota bacterium]